MPARLSALVFRSSSLRPLQPASCTVLAASCAHLLVTLPSGVPCAHCALPTAMCLADFLSSFSFLFSLVVTASAAKSLQSCPTLCNPIDGSPPGSPIPGILQARTLEWVAISFSNASKWKVKVKSLSRVRPSATPWTATYQAPPSMGFSRQEYWSGVPLLLRATLIILSQIPLLTPTQRLSNRKELWEPEWDRLGPPRKWLWFLCPWVNI